MLVFTQTSSSYLNGDEWCNSIGKVYIGRLEFYNFPTLIRCNDFFRISQNRDTSNTWIRDKTDKECCGQSETTNTPSYTPTLQISSPYPSQFSTSNDPTLKISMSPTIQESDYPSLLLSFSISFSPTGFPTKRPTTNPSSILTKQPSDLPTKQPSLFRTYTPTVTSSHLPSLSPNKYFTLSPSRALSHQPSSTKTMKPSLTPSIFHSSTPTEGPSFRKTAIPSHVPSDHTSHTPSNLPSTHHSHTPSSVPTREMTLIPTFLPSNFPSHVQSLNPSMKPSNQPTVLQSPSKIPTNVPSKKLLSSVPSETQSWVTVPTSKVTNSPSRHLRNTLSPSNLPSAQHTTNGPTTEPSNTPFPSFVRYQRPTNRNSEYHLPNSQYPTEMNEEWVPISLQSPTSNNNKDEVGSNAINKTAFAAGIPLGALVAFILGWKIQKFFKNDKSNECKSETEEEVINPEQYEHVRIGTENSLSPTTN